MSQFEKHFTVGEARSLLPDLKRKFQELHDLRDAIKVGAPRHEEARKNSEGNGGGGDQAVSYLEANVRFQEILREIAELGIEVKDVGRGLVDFPHMMAGKEVFLCWQLGEDTLSFWHELEAGFAGRKLLSS